jgi:hypothetical protein
MFGFGKRRLDAIERELVLQRALTTDLSSKIASTAGAALSVRIAELEAALSALQTSNRRELGRLWKIVARDAPRSDPGSMRSDDPEVDAWISLQHAPPHGLKPNGE